MCPHHNLHRTLPQPAEGQTGGIQAMTTGTCHGYPVPEADPMRNEMLERWDQL